MAGDILKHRATVDHRLSKRNITSNIDLFWPSQGKGLTGEDSGITQQNVYFDALSEDGRKSGNHSFACLLVGRDGVAGGAGY